MKSRHPRFVLISLTSAALCGVLAAAPASAADSACKGLAEAQCAAMAGCGWTQGYTRKDGKAVAGYCKKGNERDAAAAKDKDKAPAAPPAVKTPAAPPAVKAPAPAPAFKAPAPPPAVKAPAPAPAGTAAGQTPAPK